MSEVVRHPSSDFDPLEVVRRALQVAGGMKNVLVVYETAEAVTVDWNRMPLKDMLYLSAVLRVSLDERIAEEVGAGEV